MPWNDYITLMLINTSASLLLIAAFFKWGLTSPRSEIYSPGFLIVGIISFATGLHMTLTWPIPAPFAFANVAFGEMSLMLGAIMLGLCLAVGKRWPLHSVAVVSVLTGLASIVIGLRIANLGLTQGPAFTATGFILTGTLPLLAVPTVANPTRVLRGLMVILSLLAAGMWAFTGLMGYWGHVAGAAAFR